MKVWTEFDEHKDLAKARRRPGNQWEPKVDTASEMRQGTKGTWPHRDTTLWSVFLTLPTKMMTIMISVYISLCTGLVLLVRDTCRLCGRRAVIQPAGNIVDNPVKALY